MAIPMPPEPIVAALRKGLVIPAHPLALNGNRRLDQRRQRALTRYYLSAGAGGVAVGVHTTQFAIREPRFGMFKPVLELASETVDAFATQTGRNIVKIGGIMGQTPQAVREAAMLRERGYHLGLLSLGALKNANVDQLVDHCLAVSQIIPLMGFYLQPAVGGRVLPIEFWRRFAQIENVLAIKIAPFNRYQTLDVLQAVAEAGRARDIALYTGNDDNIIVDLLSQCRFHTAAGDIPMRMVGGLLGQWACWTRRAVRQLEECHRLVAAGTDIPQPMLTLANEVTVANAAIFDARTNFAGCIPGINEVLRRQGLLEGRWCLDPNEDLTPGQMDEIDAVYEAYPHLNDDAFVARHLDEWLR